MDHDKTGVNSVSAPDAMVDSNVLGGPQQPDAEEYERQAQEASSPGEAADPELEGLALTSSITELAYALEAVSTLIFEIQELRHLSASGADASAEGGQTTEVDAALLKLEDQLEITSKEVDALQARIRSYTKTTPAGLLRHKWDETLATWHKLQKEAEDMREELVEDKYLIVYRTVSRQAEDMMQSLEKIFAQCNLFVHELYKSCRTNSNPGKEELQKQLNTFLTLHKSLHQKTKYYIPSCEKVLKVIDSGISQQKRSLNGEILRSHADMKLRWRNLQERLSRTEKEMQGVQELLSDLSAKATRSEQQAAADSITSSSASSSSRRSSSSTPSRSSVTTARNKVGDWLSPSPSRRPSDSKLPDTAESPTHSRSITPFRRLANRLHGSKTDEPSPPSLPTQSSSTTSSSRASVSPETHRTPLPKQKAALGHYAAPAQSAPPMPRTVSSPAATVDRQNRRLSRLPTGAATAYSTPDGLPKPSYISSTTSERARSPMPPPRSSTAMSSSAIANNKPLWSVSTRPPQPADLGSSMPASSTGATRGRKSMPAPGSARKPSARYSHIPSTFSNSSSRPQSRIFTNPSSTFRPASPAFSATSNTSASATRPRPASTNSRIPAPGSSAERNETRKYYGSPGRGDELETLYFGGAADDSEEAGTSLMQRAFSPTPSQSGFSVTSSTGGGRRQSRIPRLSLGDVEPPDLKMLNIPPPPKLPDMYKESRSEIMTPEPALRSRAARVSAMYARPPASTGRKSLGPGSSEYSTPQAPQRLLAASTSALRPSSRLSVGGGSGGVGGNSRRSSFYAPSRTSSRLSSFGLPDMPNGSHSLPYHPNKHDPLDIEIASVVNSQPLYVYCQREGPPLSKIAAEAQTASDRNAFYWFAHNDKPLHCKLVDRGDRKPRKVLCKVDGQYQDLAIYLLNQQAQY